MQHRRRSRGEDAYIIWACLHLFNMARRGGEVVRWKTWQGRYLLFMCAREAAQRSNNKVTSGMIRWGTKACLASHPIEPLTSAGALVQPGGGAVPFRAELCTAACTRVPWMSSQRWRVHSDTSVWRAVLKKIYIANGRKTKTNWDSATFVSLLGLHKNSERGEDRTHVIAYRSIVYWQSSWTRCRWSLFLFYNEDEGDLGPLDSENDAIDEVRGADTYFGLSGDSISKESNSGSEIVDDRRRASGAFRTMIQEKKDQNLSGKQFELISKNYSEMHT